jgi:hypothetical protein
VSAGVTNKSTSPRGSLVGRITVVQEQRFRLTTDGGQSFLFTLGHGAPLDADTLCRLLASGTRVNVAYEHQPDLASGIAHSVQPV